MDCSSVRWRLWICIFAWSYWIDDAGHAQSSCSAGPGFIELTPGVINVIDALLTHDIRHVNTCFSSLSLTAVAVTAEDIPSYNRVGRA